MNECRTCSPARTFRAGGGIYKGGHGGDVSMSAMQLHWDIFCRVVDNFGDIGVCWRLARQLAREHGLAVRLWIDDPATLQPLCPDFDPAHPRQICQGVEIRHWAVPFVFDDAADVVVEAFACELPESYVLAMAQRARRPVWINLEYLTAEPWAESCHGMASPHPALPLVKHFFFPGFSPQTGGLLREANYEASRRDFLDERTSPPKPTTGLAASPSSEPAASAAKPLEISLFCYDTAAVGDLIDALGRADEASVCRVPPGKPLLAAKRHLGGDGPWQIGNARIEPVAFVPMDEYDQLLWRCDVNFVRGEDSFVRAQWAGPAFVWQIYPQDEDAHLIKLEAFLERYCESASPQVADAIQAMFVAWNTGRDIGDAWLNFARLRGEIAAYNARWRDHLRKQVDLASALVNFCAGKV